MYTCNIYSRYFSLRYFLAKYAQASIPTINVVVTFRAVVTVEGCRVNYRRRMDKARRISTFPNASKRKLYVDYLDIDVHICVKGTVQKRSELERGIQILKCVDYIVTGLPHTR
jgi:hypothetical protein